MSKIDQAREHYTSVLEDLRVKTNQYDHAINIRKKTLEELVVLIRSLKEIIKDLARKNKSTGRLHRLKNQYVEDYKMHLGVLMNLKHMLAATRNEAYYLELLLKGE
ncbi:MAG: hypothetical protein ACRDC4_05070 [Plesiomonas sp.]